MAIEFARVHVLSRSNGHSAVKAASYRSGELLVDERIGRTVDYSQRADEVGHSQILLPEGADESLLDRETLWSAVEAREDQHNRRADAQLAKDHIIALPRELTPAQHIELARSFAQSQFVDKGLVVDLNIHYHSDGNPHAHLMATTRELKGHVFGQKLRELNGRFYGGAKVADTEQLRHDWAAHQNTWFLEYGLLLRVSNHAGEYAAEVHLGPSHAMAEAGIETTVKPKNIARIEARIQALMDEPTIIVERVSDRKSLFTRHDLYRELSALVADTDAFQQIKAKLDVEPTLIRVVEEQGKEYLTTQRVLDMEMKVRGYGVSLSTRDRRFAIDDEYVARVLKQYSQLSDEQQSAVRHLSGDERIAMVVGLAGVGKSTLLNAVRHIYVGHGHRVTGLALAGKAAMELSASSGIESRTIASWLGALRDGRETLSAGDVLVLDEWSMVNNRTALEVLEHVHRAGAKLLAIGDGEQLQAIQAGCPFRDLAEQQGYADVSTIRRQRTAWQREATAQLARGQGAKALAAYRQHGHVKSYAGHDAAIDELVRDYLGDERDGSRIVLAHRRKDVDEINEQIRVGLIEQGRIGEGQVFNAAGEDQQLTAWQSLRAGDDVFFCEDSESLSVTRGLAGLLVSIDKQGCRVRADDGRELEFTHEDYPHLRDSLEDEEKGLSLAAGDRVVFTRNDGRLGVKNGQLGTVNTLEGQRVSITLDEGGTIAFGSEEYDHLRHGYAITIHKAQGMTVDHAQVLASGTMDKHLGYVGLSRHRESLTLYAGRNQFKRMSLAECLERVNRQETVLDFAERHGVVHAQVHQGQDRFDEKVLEIDERAGKIDERESASIAQIRAQLDEETARRVADLEAIKREEIAALAQTAEQAASRLAAHRESEPRSGWFASKSRQREWQDTQRSLERDAQNTQLARQREERLLSESASAITATVRRQVEEAHPRWMQRVKKHEAAVQRLELIDQWKTLSSTLGEVRLRNDRTGVRRTHEVEKQLMRVLKTLTKDPEIGSSVSEKQLDAMERTLDTLTQQHNRSRDRGLERE